MRIFFSVGEPSGDLHAANLIKHLRAKDASIECVGYGGPKMAAAGCVLHYDLTALAVMFIVEALKKIRTFLKLAKDAETYFQNNEVDGVVLIDYPGFNWWVARRAKRNGIPVFYYGVPQMWAWGGWRVKKIRKWVDHVLCKLPFEVDWFEQRDCKATYVGHPFFDQLHSQQFDSRFMDGIKPAGTRLLTLLPGSRNKEVENHLPTLLRAASIIQQQVANVKVAVAGYNSRQYKRAAELIAGHETDNPELDAELFLERTPELMKSADACIACSGSVSLELMFHRKPTVIVYRPSRLFMFLQRFMLKIKFITLVNLIGSDRIRRTKWSVYDPDAPGAEQAVMPEYLSISDRSDKIAAHVVHWFKDESAAAEKVALMDELCNRYAKSGATARAAEYIISALNDPAQCTDAGRNNRRAA